MAEQVTMQYDDEATIIYNVKSAEMKPVKNCDTADSRLSGTPKMTDAPELRHSPSANSSGDCVSTGLAGNHPKPQKSCHLDKFGINRLEMKRLILVRGGEVRQECAKAW